jgi:hypothetical protein
MAAVGRPGKLENLHEDFHGSELPKGRKDISEIALEGGFR